MKIHVKILTYFFTGMLIACGKAANVEGILDSDTLTASDTPEDSGNLETDSEQPTDSGLVLNLCLSAGKEDFDGDEICDGTDNCLAVVNPEQTDADHDGIGSHCDPDETGACDGMGGDGDSDNVCQLSDNCPVNANSDQQNEDSDRHGDACDSDYSPCDVTGGDMDSDGLCNSADNCAAVANPDQIDLDQDFLGDECDPFIGENICLGKGGDADLDDVCQSNDNCPSVANSDQKNKDSDDLGDACDPTPEKCDDWGKDDDQDSVCGAYDNCPEKSNATQLDQDFDGIGDVCDPVVIIDVTDPPCAGIGGDPDSDDWCSFNDNCPLILNPDQADGDKDGIGDVCDTEECDQKDNDGDGQIDEGLPDGDSDSTADCNDVCPGEMDENSDSDTLMDCVDPCPDDAANDPDKDGLCSSVDNCPARSNATQQDLDGDGSGDACDTEECDGLNNDGDSQTDENMPDQDSDSSCDAIDPCPGDAWNDVDSDMRCAGVDNCPTVTNPNQLDADSDETGDLCDLDSPSSCDTPVAAQVPGAVPVPAGIRFAAIAALPESSTLYAAVSDVDTTGFGNHLLAIDIPTRSILWALYVGSSPDTIAISSDGAVIYVGLKGASVIRMVNPKTRAACLTFSTASSSALSEPLAYATQLQVMPGDNNTLIAVLRLNSYNDSQLTIFENGIRWPQSTPPTYYSLDTAVCQDGTIYSTTGYSGASLKSYTIENETLSLNWTRTGITDNSNYNIECVQGKLFCSNGSVIDPERAIILGDTPGTGPVAVNSAGTEFYQATSRTNIAVYSAETFTLVRNIPMTGLTTGYAKSLIRVHGNTLAFLTDVGEFAIVNL